MAKQHPLFTNYGASISGDVIYLKRGNVLKPRLQKRGYHEIKISFNGKPKTYLAHRFVIECFIGKIGPAQTVDHIDFNKTNNHINNLRVLSASENHKEAIRNGRIKKGFGHYATLFGPIESLEIKKLFDGGQSKLSIARKFNCSNTAIITALRLQNGTPET